MYQLSVHNKIVVSTIFNQLKHMGPVSPLAKWVHPLTLVIKKVCMCICLEGVSQSFNICPGCYFVKCRR